MFATLPVTCLETWEYRIDALFRTMQFPWVIETTWPIVKTESKPWHFSVGTPNTKVKAPVFFRV